MIRESDLDDDVDFDIFANYGSKSALRIKRDVIEDCWRSGAHIATLVYCLQRSVSVRRRELHPIVPSL